MKSYWVNIYVRKDGSTYAGGIHHSARESCTQSVLEIPGVTLNSRVRVTLK